jgi:hypothetical protein
MNGIGYDRRIVTDPSRQRRLAYFAWVAVCLIWGTTYLGIRISLESMPPALMGGFRWTIAGGLLLLYLRARGDSLPPRSRWGGIVLLGFLLLGLGNGGVVFAEQWVPSGLAAVMVASSPFWMSGVEACLRDGERLTGRVVAGLLIGFAGIVILVWPDLTVGSAGGRFVWGVIALQVASFGWALGSSYSRRHARQDNVLAWSADYVLTVARDDRSADVDGWVTLTNGSGTAFRNARLQLVAGELNRVRQAFGRMEADMLREARAAAAPAPMSQESFSEYHLYTLDRKTTVNNNETKQVSLLGATAFPVQKRYVVDGQAFYYRNAQSPGSPIKDVVKVFYQFKNETTAGLGMPMPAGVVRVYQSDSKGGTHFVGEDRIDHTPKDETLNLKIGNAFDVVAERKQIDFEKIASNVYEMEFEIVLRNHKTVPVTVEVNEPIGGTWRIIRSTHEGTKTDAWAAQFTVPVAVDGEATLRYRVRVTY